MAVQEYVSVFLVELNTVLRINSKTIGPLAEKASHFKKIICNLAEKASLFKIIIWTLIRRS